jgi:polyhydroxybutyrate depolymerase
VAFLEAAAAEAQEMLCGDRVLAAGFSAGAMMAHRWGCEGKQVDAVLPSSGPLMFGGACGSDPLPVRHHHGTADERVPYGGGTGDRGVNDFKSVDITMAAWRERNQCTDAPPTIETQGNTTCESWSCAASTELCTIHDFGHAWPGGLNTGADIDATRAGWAWFRDLVPGQTAR